MPTVNAVLAGNVQPLQGTLSGIDKKPLSGRQRVESLGLAGDRQADLRVHGGPDKALHCYAWRHYDYWRERLPGHPLLEAPGAFGENLSIAGMDEQEVCIADHWRIGTTLLTVTQGRQPCFKLNLRFGTRSMAAWVQESLRAGWYLRVLKPGTLAAGDRIELVDRPHPDFTIARLLAVIRDRDVHPATLSALLALPLTPSWRRLFGKRLEHARAEDWTGRLEGH